MYAYGIKMRQVIISLFFLINLNMVLFDFNVDSDLKNWRVIDDVVMGGRSDGNLSVNKEGHAVFSGEVSLENNGGFSSIRARFKTIDVSDYSKVLIRLKGDGKKYQFRVKTESYDYHSYVITFETSGEWETISLPLKDMIPQFRGRRLRMENFPGKQIEEIAFLIGNKKAEDFTLFIDKIELE